MALAPGWGSLLSASIGSPAVPPSPLRLQRHTGPSPTAAN